MERPQELARSLFQTVVEEASDGILVLNSAGSIILSNPAATTLFELDEAELDGQLFGFPIADGAPTEINILRENNSPATAEMRAREAWWQGERVFVAILRDITERARAEARLKLAANVFTHAREGIIITDPDGTIIDVNDTFTRITGYSRAEAVGQNPRLLKSARQPPEFYTAMWRALIDDGHWSGEIWNRRKSGEGYAEILTISAVRDSDNKTQNYVALFTDITTLKEHQQQLEIVAHYDALTNMPNRVLLADRLKQAVTQSHRHNRFLAVAYLDLDGFKAINDQHGHDVGDELLISIAQRMKHELRDGDTLARLGGDEFVVVMVDLTVPQDCEPLLARLLQAACAPVPVGDMLLNVSASIGVTLYPKDGADADQLLRHADQAMYQAKLAGKNRYHLFDVAQDLLIKNRRESLEAIQGALARNEFVLHYQPKVNMRTGATIGVEALIRWNHPDHGLLAPEAFLPNIENHPLSIQIGEWVIDTALAQIEIWQASGIEMPISVNVSAHQLLQKTFLARLAALMAAHPGIRPGALELEILETSALKDMAYVSSLMRACREMGVSFALDDFGTGYSSLTYLKNFPADLLKVDRSFVLDMLGDPDDLAIVVSVLGLANAFNRRVIAEGVETVAHGELLLLLGCEFAQGFGISRPMPAFELCDWMAHWKPDPAWTSRPMRATRRDDLAPLFADVQHRQWLVDMERFLTGEQELPPSLNLHDCYTDHWLNTEGRQRYAKHPLYSMLMETHEHVHRLGRELVELRRNGMPSEAIARLRELHLVRDELIASLRRVLRSF